jgi:hypothetical protein
MADIKQAFGTVFTFTKTNANLANSPTAGWKSNARDNSTNKFLDCLIHLRLAAVNTAPANSRLIYLYAYALLDDAGSAYSSTGDGTPDGNEGAMTFPDVTVSAIPLPLLGAIPYPVQNKAINAGPFSVASCFGGILPPKWGIAMINHSGMTLSVTEIEGREIYHTV